jgi:hypothetical protein
VPYRKSAPALAAAVAKTSSSVARGTQMAAAVASPASMGFTSTAPFPSGQARVMVYPLLTCVEDTAGMAGLRGPSGLLAEAGRRLGQPEV